MVDDPAVTVTELGTVAFALLLVSDTVMAVVAVPLKVTVQVEDAGGITLDGLQARPVRVVPGCVMVTKLLLPLLVMTLPLASTAMTAERPNAADVSVVFAIRNVTDAILPLAMALMFVPVTMHRTSPADGLLQVADLPAAEAAAPVA